MPEDTPNQSTPLAPPKTENEDAPTKRGRQIPSIGRIVLFALPSGSLRPAMIVDVDYVAESVTLQVAVDGANDDGDLLPDEQSHHVPVPRSHVLRADVKLEETEPGSNAKPGCCYWPPRA